MGSPLFNRLKDFLRDSLIRSPSDDNETRVVANDPSEQAESSECLNNNSSPVILSGSACNDDTRVNSGNDSARYDSQSLDVKSSGCLKSSGTPESLASCAHEIDTRVNSDTGSLGCEIIIPAQNSIVSNSDTGSVVRSNTDKGALFKPNGPVAGVIEGNLHLVSGADHSRHVDERPIRPLFGQQRDTPRALEAPGVSPIGGAIQAAGCSAATADHSGSGDQGGEGCHCLHWSQL